MPVLVRQLGHKLVQAPGCSEGNAFEHGRYSAEAMSGRREVAALIRAMRSGRRHRGGELSEAA
jgi:hypothetical protein